MGLLRRLFSKDSGSNKDTSASSSDGRNRQYEQQLAKAFKLEYSQEGWSFESDRVVQDFADQLVSAEPALEVLNQLRDKIPFDSICIVTGTQAVVVVCNSTPEPVCIITKLGGTEVGNLIADILKSTGGQVNDYQGTFMLKMP